MELKNKKVLLISARFFNYDEEIKLELERKGAIVSKYDQRPANDFLTKVLIRLNFKFFIKNKINSYYKKITRETRNNNYDYIFLVSPEAIDIVNLKKIKDIHKNAKVFIYMWDSIKNKKQALSLLPLADKFFSFDSNDIKINNIIRFLPLFYVDDYKNILKGNEYIYDISFIGTIHSDRYNILKKIEKFTKYNNLRIYSYFYSPSKLLFFFQKLLKKDFKNIDNNDISFIPLSKNDILKVIKQSKCIIDVQHPSQSGLTMRTIEILGAKRKLMTTNEYIKEYDFYKKSNIFILNRETAEIDIGFFNLEYEAIEEKVYEKYSISNWIDSIFK